MTDPRDAAPDHPGDPPAGPDAPHGGPDAPRADRDRPGDPPAGRGRPDVPHPGPDVPPAGSGVLHTGPDAPHAAPDRPGAPHAGHDRPGADRGHRTASGTASGGDDRAPSGGDAQAGAGEDGRGRGAAVGVPPGGDDPVRRATGDELARVVREHAGRLATSLVSLLGDFSAAEDLVQDAVETALVRWPVDGVPERPEAWLFTVARRRGLDLLRRESNYRDKLARLSVPERDEPDDRLRLIFICCHPALPRQAQIALTLRVVCGLTTAQIAAAFLASESTVAQRITRAKRKIAEAGIPYRVPAADELSGRLREVLTVIYLLFNEGYLSSTLERAQARDLVDDAEWLASLLAGLVPDEPEVAGLLALIRLHRARGAARFGQDGRLVLLADQDRSLWDRTAIDLAIQLLTGAARRHRRPGPYQLQAAIAACHAEAGSWAETDWRQIVVLYDMLLRLAPSPVARLNRAVAVRYVDGAEAALAELKSLDEALDRYPLLHATRAELLRALGRREEAREADRRALALTANPAQQALLEERLTWS
ncbi:RNA polymerase sigma factor [Nonomuraea phyllanthi]|uniref:RNA polymerase sigma factor n=1 Tax=Nonomuraea phyllanthi TaxID=2219224 RepID=UPI001D004A4B|nr:sigma-70 family RNA polymerase sigma factor [Nonomuraea phyllanthi]